MVTIVDYGVGNLFSVVSGLKYIGAETEITSDPDKIYSAEKLILPGVGAFGDAAALLSSNGLGQAVVSAADKGTPLLGICLGMQLLFDKSYEFGQYNGLKLIPGQIHPLRDDIPPELKVPQMGWNPLKILREDPLLDGIDDGDCVYFVHSFYAKYCNEYLSAVSEYSVSVPALVRKDNVWGAQFHPEKSGDVGLRILKNFTEGIK